MSIFLEYIQTKQVITEKQIILFSRVFAAFQFPAFYLFILSEQKYVLLANRENVVGRRDCSILVGGDAAVSRKHAVIQLSHPEVAVVSV